MNLPDLLVFLGVTASVAGCEQRPGARQGGRPRISPQQPQQAVGL